jgi:hypothetical protein
VAIRKKMQLKHKSKIHSDTSLKVTDEIRTSEADEPKSLGLRSEDEGSVDSSIEEDPEEVVVRIAETRLEIDQDSKFVKGPVQFVVKDSNELLDKKLYKANRALRRKDVKEQGMWHKDRFRHGKM